MVFFMFVQFGVDFASRICRFYTLYQLWKISARTEIFFSCAANLYIYIRLT